MRGWEQQFPPANVCRVAARKRSDISTKSTYRLDVYLQRYLFRFSYIYLQASLLRCYISRNVSGETVSVVMMNPITALKHRPRK